MAVACLAMILAWVWLIQRWLFFETPSAPSFEQVGVFARDSDEAAQLSPELEICPRGDGTVDAALAIHLQPARPVQLRVPYSTTSVKALNWAVGNCVDGSLLSARDVTLTNVVPHPTVTNWAYPMEWWTLSSTLAQTIVVWFQWTPAQSALNYSTRTVAVVLANDSFPWYLPGPDYRPYLPHAHGFGSQERLTRVTVTLPADAQQVDSTLAIEPGSSLGPSTSYKVLVPVSDDSVEVRMRWIDGAAADRRDFAVLLAGAFLGVLGGAVANLAFDRPRRHSTLIAVVLALLSAAVVVLAVTSAAAPFLRWLPVATR